MIKIVGRARLTHLERQRYRRANCQAHTELRDDHRARYLALRDAGSPTSPRSEC